MRYKGKLESQTKFLTRHPGEGVAASGARAFTLHIRGENASRPGAEIKQGVSIRGDSLFSDMQKEVMND